MFVFFFFVVVCLFFLAVDVVDAFFRAGFLVCEEEASVKAKSIMNII